MKINSFDMIKGFSFSEKSIALRKQNKYVFEVHKLAKKHRIKQIIERMFNVVVISVNIMNQIGKKKVFKSILGTRNSKKKAIVSIKHQHVIDFNKLDHLNKVYDEFKKV